MVVENHAKFSSNDVKPPTSKRKIEFELPDGNTVNFRDGISRCTDNILPQHQVYEEIIGRLVVNLF